MKSRTSAHPVVVGFLAVLVALAFTVSARAMSYGFDSITNLDPDNSAVGESQFMLEVSPLGLNYVQFALSNVGSAPSSITHVYFDDGDMMRMLGIAALVNFTSGVAFSQPADPANLPGSGNISPPFDTTFRNAIAFSADSDGPDMVNNGINVTESLGVLFALADQVSFADIVTGLNGGSLRVGIVAQGFENQGAESFVNQSAASAGGGDNGNGVIHALPDTPATLLLLGCAMIGLEALRRKLVT